MAMNQMNHQENVTTNLQNITSNPVPLLPTPELWLQISWGDLIIMPLIMVMFKFTVQMFWLNSNLNQLHIHTPLRLNQLMMMKCIIFWNSFIQNTIKIFWMLTSRCFKLDWWSPLLQYFIQSLLCCFINTEKRIFQSQIACHNFLCLSQPRPLRNRITETRDMPIEFGSFYIAFTTVQLYIQLYQFTIVKFNLPTLSNQVPLHFMLVLKRLKLNLLNIVTLLNLKVVLR